MSSVLKTGMLLTATIVLGVLGPMRVSSSRWPRFAIRALHRDLALLSIAVIALHVVAVVLEVLRGVNTQVVRIEPPQ